MDNKILLISEPDTICDHIMLCLKENTQEEILMRDECPQLYEHLVAQKDELYPIDDDTNLGLLFTEKVPFRKNIMNVISCAAIAVPKVFVNKTNTKKFKYEDDRTETLIKMLHILDTAKTFFKDVKDPHLILGGWGCGVFQNPPEEIVELWKYALSRVFVGNVYFPIYSQERILRHKETEVSTLYDVFKELEKN